MLASPSRASSHLDHRAPGTGAHASLPSASSAVPLPPPPRTRRSARGARWMSTRLREEPRKNGPSSSAAWTSSVMAALTSSAAGWRAAGSRFGLRRDSAAGTMFLLIYRFE